MSSDVRPSLGSRWIPPDSFGSIPPSVQETSSLVPAMLSAGHCSEELLNEITRNGFQEHAKLALLGETRQTLRVAAL